VTKAQLLLVTDNPNAFGKGVEAEVALGTAIPLVHFPRQSGARGLVIGIEGVVFARFGLQVLQRELIGTDWGFSVPFVWYLDRHWLRIRYHHTSNHMGDEYSRRFDDPGVNVSRDAVDALGRFELLPWLGTHAGFEWAYNVHPQESGRWIVRGGAEAVATGDGTWLPYASVDMQSDQDMNWEPRWSFQAGVWLPSVAGRKKIRFGAEVLEGPSPVAQFQRGHTFHIGIGIFATL
jgi:hypothetical protein